MDAAAREPFLKERETANGVEEVEEAFNTQGEYEDRKLRNDRFPTFSQIGIHVLVFILYTALSVGYVSYALRGHAFSCPESQTSIRGIEIGYEPSTFPRLSESEYAGEPSGSIDRKWAELTASMQMRVSKPELEREGHRTSVELPEGGGHVVWFGVYHSLHCINMLRKAAHPGYYGAGAGTAPDAVAPPLHHHDDATHVEHCVELLRRNAVCRPDLSLTTFKWGERRRLPVLNVTETTHRCVDWQAFTKSFRHRIVSDDELKRLKNPLLSS